MLMTEYLIEEKETKNNPSTQQNVLYLDKHINFCCSKGFTLTDFLL